MKKLHLAAAALLLTMGACAHHEAPCVDEEFGRTTQTAMESQIAYPGPVREWRVPEGIEGIDAEEVMKAYNKGFNNPPTTVKIFSFGLF